MTFVLLASVTILNMLIGVLTEVVRNVAFTEKEAATVTHVTQQLKAARGVESDQSPWFFVQAMLLCGRVIDLPPKKN